MNITFPPTAQGVNSLLDQLRRRPRHLFLPYVPFRIAVFPQGDAVPSYLEKAVLFLIEGYDREGRPMKIDDLIYRIALGEPAGRELINGLWRKGWLIIDGWQTTLTLTSMMKKRFEDTPRTPDFANLGTGSAPFQVQCFFDLIAGRPFVAPQERRDDRGGPPYVIRPFYANSETAPFGIPMMGFMDLHQKDLLEALRTNDSFKKSVVNSAETKIDILPPDYLPNHSDIRYLRLFFHVDRDRRNVFALRSAEENSPILSNLANAVARTVSERVLNSDAGSDLRQKFLDEVPLTNVKPPRVAHGAAAQIRLAIDKFAEVTADGTRKGDIVELYTEARQLAKQGLQVIEERLFEIAARQVEIEFLPNRKAVDEAADTLLRSFGKQAVLTAATFTDNMLIDRIQRAEANPREGRLLMQVGGGLTETKSNELRRRIKGRQTYGAAPSGGRVRISYSFPTAKDPSVAAAVLIADADDLVLSATSFMSEPKAASSGFLLKMMAPAAKSAQDLTSANAALDMITAVYPTFVSPAPDRKMQARRRAKARSDDDLRARFLEMIEDMDREAEAMAKSYGEGDAAKPVVTDRALQQLCDLSRLRLNELRSIETQVKAHEQEAPVTAHGISELGIFETACSILSEHMPKIPFYVGLTGLDAPDEDFIAVLTGLMNDPRFEDGNLIFLDRPCEAWDRHSKELLAKYPAKFHVHSIYAKVLPFVVCSSGCLTASGGVDRRSFTAPRRRDKTHLGFELKGKHCQAPFLEMLKNTLRIEPYSVEAMEAAKVSEGVESLGILPSTIYRRWLMTTSLLGLAKRAEGVAPNLGANVLTDALRKHPGLFDRCLKDAITVKDLEYERALQKAAVLAHCRSRDDLALWHWDRGAIFEAALLAQAPPAGHLLAAPDLRRFVRAVVLSDKAKPQDLRFEPVWLQCAPVLTLAALGILDPDTRAWVRPLLEAKLPETGLGRFVAALERLAHATKEGPLVWTASDQDQLAYGPVTYFGKLISALEGFESDRGNQEAKGVQTMLRRDFPPLKAVFEERAGLGKDMAGTFGKAAKVLTEAYGPEFLKTLGTKGGRERIAQIAVDAADKASRERPDRSTLRPFVGGKKKGMVAAVARFLDLMRIAAILGGAVASTVDAPLKTELRKAAGQWRAKPVDAEPATPLALLAEAAEQDGRAFPYGKVNYRLWRYPRLVAILDELPKGADAGDAILQEEWPVDADYRDVVHNLLANRKYSTVDHVLALLEDQVAVANHVEKEREIEELRDALTDQVDQRAVYLLAQTQRLIQDCAQLGLAEKADLREVFGLYCDEDLDPREVEDLEATLLPMETLVEAHASAKLEVVLDQTGITRDAEMAAVLYDDQFGQWYRRLAFAHYLARNTSRCAPAEPEFARDVGSMREKLRKLEVESVPNLKQVASRLSLGLGPESRYKKITGFLRAAIFGLQGKSHATQPELAAFVTALEGLLSDDSDAFDRVLIGEIGFTSEMATVACPGGEIEAWLGWQLPSHNLFILASERSDDINLGEVDIPVSPIPVFLNPFRVSPSIGGRHIMINLIEILTALTVTKVDFKTALFTAVAVKTPLEIIIPTLPDGAEPRPDKAANLTDHLQRLLGKTWQIDLARRLEPGKFHDVVRELMERLRVEFKLTKAPALRALTKPVELALVPTGLAFLAAGWCEDAYELVREVRRRSQVESRPEAKLLFTVADLPRQAEASYRRWQSANPGDTDRVLPKDYASKACMAIWTARDIAGATLRDDMQAHLNHILPMIDDTIAERLCAWMVDEDVVLVATGGWLRPNPAHPFASIRL